MLGVILVIVGLIAVGAFAAYNAYQRYVQRVLTVPGCQAGTGANAIGLDFGQTADAATVAGVAARDRLPREALTVAYATAWQESKLENLPYGDRDSVGIFQQRPSEGWGSTAQLEDPAYAAGAFFGALVKIPGYAKLPVDVAAQDVQHSADGAAYEQYAAVRRRPRGRPDRRPARGHLLVRPGLAGGQRGRFRQAEPARGAQRARGRLRPAERGRGGDLGQRGPFGRLGRDFRRPGGRLDGGRLARRQCQLLRHHAGQLRWVPVDGRTERNELAGRIRSGPWAYCRQLAGPTAIMFASSSGL